jgi:4-amino-4-deoxy-L-arabinose transferase-like glycosyltransferase
MIKQPSFIGIVLLVFILRVLIAIYLPLGNDEVYYLLYARFPSYHYYDHPLLVGWFLKIFSFNLFWENNLGYRLFAIVLSIPTVIFIYRSMMVISNQRAAQLAVLLFLSSIYNFVIAGIFVMPDAPMLFFWTLSIYLAILTFFDRHKTGQVEEYYFIPLCFALGLTCLSKFHGIFLIFGIIGFIFFYRRSFLKSWTFWEGIVILILFSFPIIYWNYKNDWVQFDFYSNRVPEALNFKFSGIGKELIGQIAYANPVVYFFIITFAIFKFRRIKRINTKAFLLWTSLPFIVAVFIVALFKETLPHWSGPSYVSLIMLSSLVADGVAPQWKLISWIRLSLFSVVIISILGLTLINFYPGTLGNKKESDKYGSGDFTLDMCGWNTIGNKIRDKIDERHLDHLVMVSDNWFPAAHIDQYICREAKIPFFVLGEITSTHHYNWVNKARGGWQLADSALTIVPSNYFRDPAISFKNYYSKVDKIDLIPQYRNGELVRYFHLYLLSGVVKK